MTMNRREMLKGLGLAGIMGLCPPVVRAQPRDLPKRVVFLLTPNGSNVPDAWGDSDPAVALRHSLAPLHRFRDDISLVFRLHNAAGDTPLCPHLDHDSDFSTLLTGEVPHLPDNWQRSSGAVLQSYRRLQGMGRSIDLALADEMGSSPLLMGVGTASPTQAHWAGPRMSTPLQRDPFTLFERLFPGQELPGVSRETGLSVEALRRLRQRSVLDGLRAQTLALGQSLNRDERFELCRRLDAIRDAEMNLAALDGEEESRDLSSCQVPEIPTSGAITGIRNYGPLIDVSLKLLAQSLACNLTQNISLNLYVHDIFGFVNDPDTGSPLTHDNHQYQHPTSHGITEGMAARRRMAMQRWYAERIATFVEELDSIREGEGTLLDNTLIVWLSEQGNGMHRRDEHGVALIGRMGGAVRRGVRVNFPRRTRTLNDLYLTLFQMIRAPRETFGRRDLCNGPIRELLAT